MFNLLLESRLRLLRLLRLLASLARLMLTRFARSSYAHSLRSLVFFAIITHSVMLDECLGIMLVPLIIPARFSIAHDFDFARRVATSLCSPCPRSYDAHTSLSLSLDRQSLSRSCVSRLGFLASHTPPSVAIRNACGKSLMLAILFCLLAE